MPLNQILCEKWSAAVAEAEELRDQAGHGELSELELKERLGKL